MKFSALRFISLIKTIWTFRWRIWGPRELKIMNDSQRYWSHDQQHARMHGDLHCCFLHGCVQLYTLFGWKSFKFGNGFLYTSFSYLIYESLHNLCKSAHTNVNMRTIYIICKWTKINDLGQSILARKIRARPGADLFTFELWLPSTAW